MAWFLSHGCASHEQRKRRQLILAFTATFVICAFAVLRLAKRSSILRLAEHHVSPTTVDDPLVDESGRAGDVRDGVLMTGAINIDMKTVDGTPHDENDTGGFSDGVLAKDTMMTDMKTDKSSSGDIKYQNKYEDTGSDLSSLAEPGFEPPSEVNNDGLNIIINDVKSNQNMNGLYEIQNGLSFNTDFASRGHKFFDVYSPEIASRYAENLWMDLGNNPLPEYIVDKFRNGKTIAITGYEHDQVMVFPSGQPGLHPETDVSVPFSWAYNHHYMAYISGVGSKMEYQYVRKEDVDATGYESHAGRRFNETHLRIWAPVETGNSKNRNGGFDLDGEGSIPKSQMFSEANGGESRMSYHGYPSGYAQLVKEPVVWHVTPMQIDTRNRECGIQPKDILHSKKCPFLPEEDKFYYPGVEPKQSQYGRHTLSKCEGPRHTSGLLECPCTSRWGGDPSIYGEEIKTKQFDEVFEVVARKYGCSDTRHNPDLNLHAKTCFDAAAAMLPTSTTGGEAKNFTVNDERKYPVGCSVTFDPSPRVFFNNASSSSKMCSDQGVPMDGSAVFDTLGISARVEIIEVGDDVGENIEIDGSVGSKSARKVRISLTGPSDRWFAVAFNATQMADTPYALVIEQMHNGGAEGDNDGPAFASDHGLAVSERILGTCGEEAGHCISPPILPSSIKVVKVDTNVKKKRCLVVIERDAVVVEKSPAAHGGFGGRRYNFDPSTQASIPMLGAHGMDENSNVVSYHGPYRQTGVTLSLLDPRLGSFNCVCADAKRSGSKMCDSNGDHCTAFVKSVSPPCLKGDQTPDCGSLETDRNPTVTPRGYSGGLLCCGNGRVLLDLDQEPPQELLKYHMKFRFWYEEYTGGNGKSVQDSDDANIPELNATTDKSRGSSGKRLVPSHQNLIRLYQQTENNSGEYDVPPAFRESIDKPIPGYPDWPMDTPTPGTTCTKECWDEGGRSHVNNKTNSVNNSEERKNANVDNQGCECTHTIIRKWPFKESSFLDSKKVVKLMYANGHCHAPSCTSIHLYRRKSAWGDNNRRGDEGQKDKASAVRILKPTAGIKGKDKGYIEENDVNSEASASACDVDLTNYELLCVQKPRYGKGKLNEDKFDDKGYIRTPPCLWSDDARDGDSLPSPPHLRYNDELLSIKKNRNTFNGHYGEMASWQMRGAFALYD